MSAYTLELRTDASDLIYSVYPRNNFYNIKIWISFYSLLGIYIIQTIFPGPFYEMKELCFILFKTIFFSTVIVLLHVYSIRVWDFASVSSPPSPSDIVALFAVSESTRKKISSNIQTSTTINYFHSPIANDRMCININITCLHSHEHIKVNARNTSVTRRENASQAPPSSTYLLFIKYTFNVLAVILGWWWFLLVCALCSCGMYRVWFTYIFGIHDLKGLADAQWSVAGHCC